LGRRDLCFSSLDVVTATVKARQEHSPACVSQIRSNWNGNEKI